MKRVMFFWLCLLPLAASAQVDRIIPLDRIVAVVNDDVIVKSELDRRVRAVMVQLRQKGTRAPPRDILEKQVLERLIITRLQLQKARETGVRVEEEMLNRAVERLAGRNGLSVAQFKDILEKDGYSFTSFRDEVRDELILDQLRKRQVENRIKVTDREIDNLLATMDRQGGVEDEYHLAHILIAVPEAASPERIEASRRRAEEILTRLLAGEDFKQLAVAESDGQQALDGGDLGWRKASQLPSLFAERVIEMKKGDVSQVLRSASGFHLIKLMDVRQGERHVVRQTHARHILIRPDELTSSEDARTRLEQLKQRIEGGDDFGDLARSHSNDGGSAVKGGDLGWISPGDVVPAFETMMEILPPGQISEPFQTPFGWHLVQVLERREHDSTEEVRRGRARDIIRRRKIEEDMQAWLRRLRDEAYVEYRLEE